MDKRRINPRAVISQQIARMLFPPVCNPVETAFTLFSCICVDPVRYDVPTPNYRVSLALPPAVAKK